MKNDERQMMDDPEEWVLAIADMELAADALRTVAIEAAVPLLTCFGADEAKGRRWAFLDELDKARSDLQSVLLRLDAIVREKEQ